MALTQYQLSLVGAQWVDTNTRFTQDNLPDRVPDSISIIYSSIFNLFNCPVGARGKIFQPEYGSEWYYFLQEPIDEQTASLMRIAMIQAIQRWEPRLILSQGRTSITADPTLPGYKVVINGFDSLTKIPINITFTEQL